MRFRAQVEEGAQYEIDETTQIYSRALDIEPSLVDAHLMLGLCLLSLFTQLYQSATAGERARADTDRMRSTLGEARIPLCQAAALDPT